ncbi:MAG: hypothetical protein AAFZ63_28010 [Bacteroidota bacterium]
MKGQWLAIAFCGVVFSCDYHSNNLCHEGSRSKTYDFEGLEVYGTIEDGLRCAQAQQKPIFLLFSGFACVGDNSYEERLFVSRRNRKIIKQNYIPIILYVDDKTKLDSSDIPYRNYGGKRRKIETVGAKNSHYEMEEFRMNTQPLLIILDHNGQPITEPIGYEPGTSTYQKYLEHGLLRYQQDAKANN